MVTNFLVNDVIASFKERSQVARRGQVGGVLVAIDIGNENCC